MGTFVGEGGFGVKLRYFVKETKRQRDTQTDTQTESDTATEPGEDRIRK